MIDAARLREVLAQTRGLLDEAAVRGGRAPGAVELVIAGKYLPAEDVPALLEAGVELLGENRLQDLLAKDAVAGGRLTLRLHRPHPAPQGARPAAAWCA